MISISVGIPAYNEEANINRLLRSIIDQNQNGWRLEDIVVISDGSSDETVARARTYQQVSVVDRKERRGVSVTQMEIMGMIESEVMILINADITIKDKNFISRLIEPIVRGEADLTAPSTKGQGGKKRIEKILETGELFKREVFEKINRGNNIYTCRGLARAMSQRLYKSIDLKTAVADDAVSFLHCIKRNWQYKYVKETEVFYKLPDNIGDYLRQSVRFIKGKKGLNKEAYNIPIKLILSSLGHRWLINPIKMTVYLGLLAWSRMVSIFKKDEGFLWEPAVSTKSLTWEQ